MTDTCTIRMWYLTETDRAYQYSKIPTDRNPRFEDIVWVPKSIVEHRTKRGDEHEIKLPYWFVDAQKL